MALSRTGKENELWKTLTGTYDETNHVFKDPSGTAYTPDANAIYIDTVTDRVYRYKGSSYTLIGTPFVRVVWED